MTSLHTNISATAALQTLRLVSRGVDAMQQQASSGLRVQTAADNAAYWSISTTMRSDNRSLSAVTDAIGMGSALVDVAARGLEGTIAVLDEVKAKIVAAKEPGVDRAKVQAEIVQLQRQAEGIAASSSFNGVNWLSTDIDDLPYLNGVEQAVPAGITRNADGFGVQTLAIDVAPLALYNASGGGVLQADPRSLGTIGGFRSFPPYLTPVGAMESYDFVGPITVGAGDTIRFDLTVDAGPYSPGVTRSVTIDRALVDTKLGTSTGVIPDRGSFATVLDAAIKNAGFTNGVAITLTGGMQRFVFRSTEQTGQHGASIAIANLTSTLAGGAAGGLQNAPVSNFDNPYAYFPISFTPFRMHRDVSFSFDLTLPGTPKQSFTITRAMVDTVLGTNDGRIDQPLQLAAILNSVLSGKGMIASTPDPGEVRLSIDQSLYPDAGYRSRFTIDNIQDSLGNVTATGLADIDIVAPSADLDAFLTDVEQMLRRTTDAAATLGAYSARIDRQEAFVETLRSTFDKGIGRLVDADLNEVSSRLRAHEAQQQLALQSLQIANSAPEAMLQLFR